MYLPRLVVWHSTEANLECLFVILSSIDTVRTPGIESMSVSVITILEINNNSHYRQTDKNYLRYTELNGL